MTYNTIKTQIFLHQALNYNQIYNFIMDHDYKFKVILVLKDVWVSKSKNVHVNLFFECFEHMDPLLWNILKFTKKLKWFDEHLIRKKDFWNLKTTYSHAFFECLKHIKGFLKHGNFHENLVIATLKVEQFFLKIKWIFWYIVFPWWFFKNLKNSFLKIVHTLYGFSLHAFTQV
jgi:hypothetical protein